MEILALKRHFFKIYNVEHLVENLNVQLQIINNHLRINNISGLFAKNTIQGSGKVEFKKIKDIPVDINFKLNASSLELPEDIITSGLLEFKLYGNWFPYNLKGTYVLNDGAINKGFNQNKNKISGLF